MCPRVLLGLELKLLLSRADKFAVEFKWWWIAERHAANIPARARVDTELCAVCCSFEFATTEAAAWSWLSGGDRGEGRVGMIRRLLR